MPIFQSTCTFLGLIVVSPIPTVDESQWVSVPPFCECKAPVQLLQRFGGADPFDSGGWVVMAGGGGWLEGGFAGLQGASRRHVCWCEWLSEL